MIFFWKNYVKLSNKYTRADFIKKIRTLKFEMTMTLQSKGNFLN